MVVVQAPHHAPGSATVFRAACDPKRKPLKRGSDINARELVGECETCRFTRPFKEYPVPDIPPTPENLAAFAQATVPSLIEFTPDEGRWATLATLATPTLLLRTPRSFDTVLYNALEYATTAVLTDLDNMGECDDDWKED
jgi:hypothetical protein